MTRTDQHRPSAPEFDPEQYMLEGVYDLLSHRSTRDTREHHEAALEVLSEGGYSEAAHQLAFQCGHCGAHLRYAALMSHPESMTYIYVGETCLEGRFATLTKAEFQRLRKAAALFRKRESAKERFQEHLEAAIEADPSLALLEDREALEDYPYFLSDLRYKMRKYPLTDRQIAAAAKVIREADERRRAEAKRRAEARPVVEGRGQIEGTVISTKWADGHFAYSPMVAKMTVQDDRGFRVYGTVPAPLLDEVDDLSALRGRRVRFMAQAETSRDDETFGFFKRPTKTVLTRAV